MTAETWWVGLVAKNLALRTLEPERASPYIFL